MSLLELVQITYEKAQGDLKVVEFVMKKLMPKLELFTL